MQPPFMAGSIFRLAVGWRSFADVNSYVKNFSDYATDKLALRCRVLLEVESSQDAFSARARLIF
jgi:hypothetical protein